MLPCKSSPQSPMLAEPGAQLTPAAPAQLFAGACAPQLVGGTALSLACTGRQPPCRMHATWHRLDARDSKRDHDMLSRMGCPHATK